MTKERKESIVITIVILSFILAGTATVTYAQGDGLAGIAQATAMITSYFVPISQLMYAVGAVFGLVGALKVFSKMQSGDPDTSKVAAAWGFACVFLVIAATILQAFFL
ncbi:MAG: DUF4134 domain-containing protein [Rikenellaceae bacterium]